MGSLGNHGQVVRDHDQRHVVLALQAHQQLHDLGLNGHIQRGSGLVGDQQFGVATDGHGNHHALVHAARELVRVGVEASPWVRYFDQLQKLQSALVECSALQAQVHFERLFELKTHGIRRVQAAERVLKNHGHVFTHNAAALCCCEL